MNEKKNNTHYLSLKELISESLMRDIILFVFLFSLIIAQAWDNLLLLLFPLITFIFSVFFRIVSRNKSKTEFVNRVVLYNPLGIEKKHANRLFFCTLFQLILIFWLGGESLYNPHLINNYFLFFSTVFIFFYTFGFFWIFIDLWKYTKIEILTNKIEHSSLQATDSELSDSIKNIVAFLKLKNLRITSYTNFLVFIIMNILSITSFYFGNSNYFVMQISLPGSQMLTLTYLFYGFLIISPSLTVILLFQNYNAINNINGEKLESLMKPLPRNLQIKILESLKAMNDKIKEQLKIE